MASGQNDPAPRCGSLHKQSFTMGLDLPDYYGDCIQDGFVIKLSLIQRRCL